MFNQNSPIDKMYSDSERKAASEHARSIFEIMMDNRAKTELDNLKRYNDVLVESIIAGKEEKHRNDSQ